MFCEIQIIKRIQMFNVTEIVDLLDGKMVILKLIEIYKQKK